ncbi:MAG: class I SAM-dependent methyltransferase [Trichloromonadaceae bacterium]
MAEHGYIMEHPEEAYRLDLKTDRERLIQQATWAGLRPGMRVLDLGCGSGKTTAFLQEFVQPGGSAVGLDSSAERIDHARNLYAGGGAEFVCGNFYEPLDALGEFDFIWVRFVLEYHRHGAFDIVRNVSKNLKQGGILCLADLDHNSLNHYGISPRLERAMLGIMQSLSERNFDPQVGRKLYAFLFDLGFSEIRADMLAHHLIYGQLNDVDEYNWKKKVEISAVRSCYDFPEYPGGVGGFLDEFQDFFASPRRFTYTPLILVRGVKPSSAVDLI